ARRAGGTDIYESMIFSENRIPLFGIMLRLALFLALAVALAAKQPLPGLGTRARHDSRRGCGRGLSRRGCRRLDAALVGHVLRLEAVHLVDRLHRLVGRMRAAHQAREPVRRAIVEAGAHEL